MILIWLIILIWLMMIVVVVVDSTIIDLEYFDYFSCRFLLILTGLLMTVPL